MVDEFTTTYAISVYRHWCCEFESQWGWGDLHYVINSISDLWQVGGFHRVLRFPPPIKLTATMYRDSSGKFMVFLVVVCKSRSSIHLKLLKSDSICNFYTNLNIEKIGNCFGGKTIITDIRKIGHVSFHSSDRKKICTSILFYYSAFLSIYFQ
jgi:hypothetical protein